MKLLFTAAMAAVYLAILWGPACMVAMQAQRAGKRPALRALRIVWPLQLATAFALLLLADGMGLGNPAGLFVASTAAASLAGAALCKLLVWCGARR